MADEQIEFFTSSRVLVWWSAGIVSSVAAKKALDKWGHEKVEVLYCDTSKDEHPDNARFTADVSKWLAHPIKFLKSKEFETIWDVFENRKFLRSPKGGAPCTVELKKRLRWEYEGPGDIHILGYAGDELRRFERFKKENPELKTEWILEGIPKSSCAKIIQGAGIRLPEMYRLGYPNNNCMGCVKAESVAYWQHIRQDFPARFKKMAELERRFGFALNRIQKGGIRYPVFLDELPLGLGKIKGLEIECGISCQTNEKEN